MYVGIIPLRKKKKQTLQNLYSSICAVSVVTSLFDHFFIQYFQAFKIIKYKHIEIYWNFFLGSIINADLFFAMKLWLAFIDAIFYVLCDAHYVGVNPDIVSFIKQDIVKQEKKIL